MSTMIEGGGAHSFRDSYANPMFTYKYESFRPLWPVKTRTGYTWLFKVVKLIRSSYTVDKGTVEDYKLYKAQDAVCLRLQCIDLENMYEKF